MSILLHAESTTLRVPARNIVIMLIVSPSSLDHLPNHNRCTAWLLLCLRSGVQDIVSTIATGRGGPGGKVDGLESKVPGGQLMNCCEECCFFCCDKVYQVHVLVREMRHVEDVEEELPGDATICPRQTIASTSQQTTASPNYCKHATMRLAER